MARQRLCKHCNEKPASWRSGGFCSYSCRNRYQDCPDGEEASQGRSGPPERVRQVGQFRPKEVAPAPKQGPPKENRSGVTAETAKTVIDRDGDHCRWCGGRREQLHHIIYRSQMGSDLPENLICLCSGCHDLVHTNVKIYRPILQRIVELPHETLGSELLETQA